ncbi:hypothetical protein E4U43_006850, partial [Claviceps pusilla]
SDVTAGSHRDVDKIYDALGHKDMDMDTNTQTHSQDDGAWPMMSITHGPWHGVMDSK